MDNAELGGRCQLNSVHTISISEILKTKAEDPHRISRRLTGSRSVLTYFEFYEKQSRIFASLLRSIMS